jgi:hypothetical protein
MNRESEAATLRRVFVLLPGALKVVLSELPFLAIPLVPLSWSRGTELIPRDFDSVYFSKNLVSQCIPHNLKNVDSSKDSGLGSSRVRSSGLTLRSWIELVLRVSKDYPLS